MLPRKSSCPSQPQPPAAQEDLLWCGDTRPLLTALLDHSSSAVQTVAPTGWNIEVSRPSCLCTLTHIFLSLFFLFASLNTCEGIFVKACQWQNQGTSLLNRQAAPKLFQEEDEISYPYLFCESTSESLKVSMPRVKQKTLRDTFCSCYLLRKNKAFQTDPHSAHH